MQQLTDCHWGQGGAAVNRLSLKEREVQQLTDCHEGEGGAAVNRLSLGRGRCSS